MKYMSFGLEERTVIKWMLKTQGGYFQNGLKLCGNSEKGVKKKTTTIFLSTK